MFVSTAMSYAAREILERNERGAVVGYAFACFDGDASECEDRVVFLDGWCLLSRDDGFNNVSKRNGAMQVGADGWIDSVSICC